MGSFLCLFLGHDWNEWAYEDAHSCKQVRKCKRDGEVEERTLHDWGGNKICRRCKSKLISRECSHCLGYGEILDMTMPGGSRGPCEVCNGNGVEEYIEES